MSSSRLQKAPTRSGHSTVQVSGIPYHSPYDPVREVEKFYRDLRLEEADIVLHFGWGLGYCGEILRKRLKADARAVIFEPDEELFKLSLAESANAAAFQDSRFQFVVGPKVCQFFDDWGLGHCRETDQFLLIEWPAALREHAAMAETLRGRLRAHLRDRAANLLTHFRNGGMYFQNAIGNFAYQRDPDAGRLFGRFRDIPLVIVSAGPSLDRNINELRGMEDRCFILAVDTALRPLLAAGVMPHAVMIADPTELNATHIAGVMPESVYLIAEQAVHISAFQAAAKRFVFGLGLFPDSLFAKFGLPKSCLGAWGSVATTALDFACRTGANPIIFTGQDFAYSWDRDYASHTIFHGRTFVVTQAPTVPGRDIFGNEVRTTENFIGYRDYFVRRIKQSPGVHFINATEGGILDQAVEILPLRDALRQWATRPVDVHAILRHSHNSWSTKADPADAIRHLQKVLSSREDACACRSEFIELTAKEQLLHNDQLEIEKKVRWGKTLVDGPLAQLDAEIR
jgi:hypothetical protein